MADAWGMPPWEIVGDNRKVLWYYRFRAAYEERARVSQKKTDETWRTSSKL